MKIKLFSGILLFIVTFSFLFVIKTFSAKTVDAEEWGFISGGVYAAYDGHPLEKAIVTATGNGYLTTKKTNPYGFWGISFPQQGTYIVTVSKPRFVTQTFTIYAGSIASSTEIFLLLK